MQDCKTGKLHVEGQIEIARSLSSFIQLLILQVCQSQGNAMVEKIFKENGVSESLTPHFCDCLEGYLRRNHIM